MSKIGDRLLSFAHSSALVENDDEKGGKTPSKEVVVEFLRKNPNPDDKKWHAWAEKSGFNVHKAEAVAYELATRMAAFMATGRAPKIKYDASKLPKDVLDLGVGVEAEHSDDLDTQMRIVGDHAAEYADKSGKVDPEAVRMYYEELLEIEKRIKAKFGIKE